MNSRLKAVAIGVACLVCCLPLVFAVTGTTAGAAGAVGYWLGRNEALLVAGIGLVSLLTVLVGHLRTDKPNQEKVPIPKRKEATP